MRKLSITIHQSIFINRSKEMVWDFTQDYTKRTLWDKTVLEASVLETKPHRVVRLKTAGNTTMTFIYKLDDRPNKTSLAMREVTSPFIESGGGFWIYENQNEGTIWTQTNTIILKNNFLIRLLFPLFKLIFAGQTKKAMVKAKEIIEQ